MLQTPEWDDIPDVGLVPSGTYQVTVAELEIGTTKGGDGRAVKSKVNTQYTVVEPIGLAGMPIFDNFTLGTDDDPDADSMDTWKKSYGCRRFKRFLASIGLELSGQSVDALCGAAIDQTLIVMVTESQEPELNRDGSPNAFAGRKRNNCDQYYQLGQREPGLAGDAAPPAAAPVAPKAAAVAPPRTAVGTARAPKTAAPGAPAPAPAPAAAPKPAAAPAKVAGTVKCRICNEMVPRPEYADHVEACEAAHAA